MPSMRPDTVENAIECNYIDAGLAETAKGPRVVLRPHSSAGYAQALSFDVDAARMLAIHPDSFVREVEGRKKE